MIYVTGDIHGNPRGRLSRACFPEGKEMTKDDYVIICGDFGCVWDYRGESRSEKYILDWMDSLPFTVLFVDGNHENFRRLNNYPECDWHGGCVHMIRPHVLHLMRGYVFDIDGKSVFAFGGASSHDIRDGILNPDTDAEKIKAWRKDYSKMFRVLNVSWWADEMPNESEYKRGLENLLKVNNKVDFVITHSPTTSNLFLLGAGMYKPDELSDYLEQIRLNTTYKKWFCGHMHVNRQLTAEDIVLYEQIIRIN